VPTNCPPGEVVIERLSKEGIDWRIVTGSKEYISDGWESGTVQGLYACCPWHRVPLELLQSAASTCKITTEHRARLLVTRSFRRQPDNTMFYCVATRCCVCGRCDNLAVQGQAVAANTQALFHP
jgi:hypothetical protein